MVSQTEKQNRPVLSISIRRMERVLDIAAWLGCAFCVLLVAVSWRFLPDTIPVHFDAGGERDGWGGKAVVLIPPIILLGPFILLTALTS